MRRHIAFLTLVVWIPASFATPGSNVQSTPNIVFILADDLGWSDTSVYGSTYYKTPNIDRLAQNGLRFTNAYAANPLCSPTRASIMTGLYPGRIGITAPACHLPKATLEAHLAAKAQPWHKTIVPVSATRLPTTYPTLAKTLREAGYATGHFGKWHLGPTPYSPLEHGFDVDIPHYPGPGPAGSYLGPWKFPPALKFTGQDGEHIEDRMAREAVDFIRAHKDKSFYLNYWAFSVHGPWDAKEDLVRTYRDKADPTSPQRNPVYAAMIHSLDDAVGTLVKTLDELKLTERTIIIFFSDNGGVHWLDERMKEQFKLETPPTSNTPLRGGKATLYEGGTREPCIVVWPGRTKPGSTTDALLSSVDFYPTLLEMVGVKAKAGQKFDGVSQVPAFLGTDAPRKTTFCFFPHNIQVTGSLPGVWVRQGHWKLIRFFHDNDNHSHRYELYDLAKDIGETQNLAEQKPEVVRELDALITQHLEETKSLLPKPNPAYVKATASAPR